MGGETASPSYRNPDRLTQLAHIHFEFGCDLFDRLRDAGCRPICQFGKSIPDDLHRLKDYRSQVFLRRLGINLIEILKTVARALDQL